MKLKKLTLKPNPKTTGWTADTALIREVEIVFGDKNPTPTDRLVFSDVTYRVFVRWEPEGETNITGIQWVLVLNKHFFYCETVPSPSKEYDFELRLDSKDYLFSECIGKAEIEIRAMKGGEIIFADITPPLQVCIPQSQEIRNIQRMAEYVREKSQGRLSNKERGIEEAEGPSEEAIAEQEKKYFKELVKTGEKILKAYERSLPFFASYSHKASSSTNFRLLDFDEIQDFSPRTFEYILTHPEELTPTPIDTGIKFGGVSLLPRRAVVQEEDTNTDTYENRVVLGFLKTFLTGCRLILRLMDQVKGKEVAPGNGEKYFDSADILGFESSETFQNLYKKFVEYKERTKKLIRFYRKYLPVQDMPVRTLPTLTPSFRSNHTYFTLYRAIKDWFSLKPFALTENDFQMDFSFTSRIYEVFSLLQIMEAAERNGFELISTDCIEWRRSLKFEESNIGRNFFRYVKGNQSFEIFVEPSIWSNEIDETHGMSLYRNSHFSLDNGLLKRTFTPEVSYQPDFVLKLTEDGKARYWIIDAKYTKLPQFVERRLVEMLFKYVLSVSSAKPNEELAGLLIVCGKMADQKKAVSFQDTHSPFFPGISKNFCQVHEVNGFRNSPGLLEMVFNNSDETNLA